MAEFTNPGRDARFGCVSISIDTDVISHGSTAATNSTARSTTLQNVLVELIDQFQRHKLPASWAVSDPATAKILPRIAGGSVKHEPALLGNAIFSQADCSRAEFVREAIQPLARAAAAGISISTVALADAWRPLHVDLLAKHGIKMIISPRLLHGSPRDRAGMSKVSGSADGIQIVRYGMWHLPISAMLHGGGWMANHAQLRLARRAVQQAVHGESCHLRIDAVSLAHADTAVGLRHVDRLLRELEQLQAGGHIAVRTLRDIAICLQPKRTVVAAHSILRAA